MTIPPCADEVLIVAAACELKLEGKFVLEGIPYVASI
jgi:hypothetical protein